MSAQCKLLWRLSVCYWQLIDGSEIDEQRINGRWIGPAESYMA